MADWVSAYPVDFTANGDRTNQAIQKHIYEIDRIYALIQQLRGNFNGAGYPVGPVRNQLYINPTTFEARVFVGLSGDDDWRELITQAKRHSLDAHDSVGIADLQKLITDAALVSLATAPVLVDSGKDLSINSSGNVELSTANKTHRNKWDIHVIAEERASWTGASKPRWMNVVIDGGGSAILPGIKCDLVLPSCSISEARLLADRTGSISVDLWKDSFDNSPPTIGDSITGSTPPSLSSAIKSSDTVLTGWTTTVSADDVLRVYVSSCTDIQRCTLALKVVPS